MLEYKPHCIRKKLLVKLWNRDDKNNLRFFLLLEIFRHKKSPPAVLVGEIGTNPQRWAFVAGKEHRWHSVAENTLLWAYGPPLFLFRYDTHMHPFALREVLAGQKTRKQKSWGSVDRERERERKQTTIRVLG